MRCTDRAEVRGVISVARRMLAAGENIEKIVKYTDLSLEDVIALTREMQS